MFFAAAGLLAGKIAILIAAGITAASCLRGSSAAARHALCTLTLLLAMALPLAALLLPAWPVFTAPWAAPAAPAADSSSLMNALPATLTFMWIAGVAILLIRELLGQLQLMRCVQRASPLRGGAWLITLGGLHELQPRRTVRILESAAISGPCTWGALRPVLLLPAAGNNWTERQRRNALIHELAHINRFDYVSTLIGRLASALHWYNPLVWFAAAETRRLQEEACDECVLGAGGRASDYAELLVSLSARPGASAALMVARSPVHRRVKAMFARTPRRRRPGAVCSLAAGLAAGTLALACAGPTAPARLPLERAAVAQIADGAAASSSATSAAASPVDLRPALSSFSVEVADPVPTISATTPVPPIPPVPPVPPTSLPPPVPRA